MNNRLHTAQRSTKDITYDDISFQGERHNTTVGCSFPINLLELLDFFKLGFGVLQVVQCLLSRTDAEAYAHLPHAELKDDGRLCIAQGEST